MSPHGHILTQKRVAKHVSGTNTTPLVAPLKGCQTGIRAVRWSWLLGFGLHVFQASHHLKRCQDCLRGAAPVPIPDSKGCQACNKDLACMCQKVVGNLKNWLHGCGRHCCDGGRRAGLSSLCLFSSCPDCTWTECAIAAVALLRRAGFLLGLLSYMQKTVAYHK